VPARSAPARRGRRRYKKHQQEAAARAAEQTVLGERLRGALLRQQAGELAGSQARPAWHPGRPALAPRACAVHPRCPRQRLQQQQLFSAALAPGVQVRRALTARCAGRGGAGGAGARARGRGRGARGAAAARGRGRPRRRGRQCAHLPADHGGARRLGAGKSRVVQGLGQGSLGPLARAPRRRCPAGERGSQRVSFFRGSSAAAVCAIAAGRGPRRPSCASMPCVHVPGGGAAGRRGIDNMPLFRSSTPYPSARRRCSGNPSSCPPG